jgi:hypothetical protein
MSSIGWCSMGSRFVLDHAFAADVHSIELSRMASRPWADEDRAFLEMLADRRDWIEVAMDRFTDRSPAAVRCMMQKVRTDLGMTDQRTVDGCWIADAINASGRLLAALQSSELRPT